MKKIFWLAGLAWGWSVTAGVEASDPMGIYALVHKVVLEPNEGKPERAQIWGVFALAKDHGYQYEKPVHGYLYYTLPEGNEEVCRAEWADMKKVSDGTLCVSFGSRYEEKGRVRKASEKAEKPDKYPLGWGGLLIARRGTDLNPTDGLLAYPLPLTPAEGDEVKPGKATVSVRTIPHPKKKDAKYVFEIEKGGDKETSQPIAPGDKETKWSPSMEIKAGESYTVRVWASAGDWKGPVATVTFKGKSS